MQKDKVKDVKRRLVSLKDEGSRTGSVGIGVNWSRIPKSYFFSLFRRDRRVDLDVGALLFDTAKQCREMIYYGCLLSEDKAVRHSGDDSSGDTKNDDNDNEIIEIDLEKISPEIDQIVFFLSAHKGCDITTLPYCKARIFVGDPLEPSRVFDSLSLAKRKSLAGKNTFIMGKLFRKSNLSWDYIAINQELNLEKVNDIPDYAGERFI